jgi:subtilase family serine protease
MGALGLILAVWITPGPVFGQAATVELSPLVAKSTLVSSIERNQQISVALTLPLSDPNGAAEFVQHVSQRGDPLFHKYLTPHEFAKRFGANESDYAALKQWAAANGLTISQESIARTALTVRGTTDQIETIFNTEINTYLTPAGDE